MSETLAFIAYSDIHHHYWQNGLTEADIMELEVDVHDLAKVYGAKAILFGGDAFQAHNPPSSLRHNVNVSIRTQAETCQVIRLVGNHDRELGSMHSAHAGSHLEWLNTPHKVTVMDRSGHYLFPDLGLSIVAVPAGHGMPRVEARVSSFRLCVFHDILTGSVHDNGVKEAKGVDPAVFDRGEFDLVLGGDNHVPQILPFINTQGWYIGAPCQHDWGDTGQERGFIAITLEARSEGVEVVDFNRIPSHAPKFIKHAMMVTNLGDVAVRFIADPTLKGNIIKIILQGDARVLSDTQRIQSLEKDILSNTGARQVRVITEPTVVFKELIPALKDSKTPEDDWKAYVASGKVDMTGLNPDTLLEFGLNIIRNTRRS
jgi:DNA repair exonuclease SbcCD nuclease subunit